jgi:hypothetical protein
VYPISSIAKMHVLYFFLFIARVGSDQGQNTFIF